MKRILLYLGVFLCLFLANYRANAQVPNISYSPSTNVYTVGTAIPTLSPTNSGGAVPATTYATVTTLVASGTFNSPFAITNDAAGNIYVADYGNNKIRKVTSAGTVTTLAGSGAASEIDGTGAGATFNGPDGIAYDGAGNLYVADANGNKIRKVVIATGAVSTYAGSGAAGSANGATLLTSTFNAPDGLTFDSSGNLYIADFSNNSIRKISSAGIITTLAGGGASGTQSGSTNGTGTAALFNQPIDLVADNSGNLFVADYGNNLIRKIVISTGVVTTFAGSGSAAFADGTGTGASFSAPASITTDVSGNFVVADQNNQRIRLISPAGVVSTIAGSGTSSETNGVGTAATFSSPVAITADNSGNCYVADWPTTTTGTLRKILLTGYTISPALPAGLTLTSSSGNITGTPTAISSATTYTIIAYNASGSASTIISIQCVRTNNWTAGSNTTAWATAGNWSANAVPGVNDNIQIGVTAYTNPKQPTLSSTTTVNSITFGATKPGVLTIATGNTLTINSSLDVNTASTATITGGAASSTVFMAAGSIVNVTGTGVLTLTSPMTFTLQSTATGDASIGQIASGAITGTAASSINVQRYITGGSSTYRGYRLLSSPVYASSVSSNNVYSINYLKNSIYLTATTTSGTGGFDNTSSANPTLYLYRENMTPTYTTFTGSNFRGINNINSSPSYTIDGDGSGYSIPAGNGYLCFFRGDRSKATFAQETVTTYVPQTVTLTASGTLNIGQVTVKDWFTPSSSNLSYTSGSPSSIRGYNLVGNPYASAIDWDTFQSSSTTTGIYGSAVGATVYMLDPVSHNYGAYISGNGGIGGTNNATNIISSGQAFFVVASSTSAKLIFNESAKTNSQNTGTNLLMGKPVNYANNQFLKLRLAKDSVNTDETVVRFNSQGNVNYVEGLDAPYKGGYGIVSLSGISKDKIDLAIDVIPLPHQQQETIGLNVTAKATGSYTLSLSDLVSVPQLYDVWLIDKYKNDSLDMRRYKTYAFDLKTSDTASFGSNRFALVIRQNQAYAYKLINFTATKIPDVQQVQVNWNTVNEGNYTNFTVERSIDGGKTFNVLGGLSAAGNGNYGLVDKNPVTGANIYRLKQEDINNVITYSNAVTIQYASLSNSLASRLTLYPNPAVNTLSLNINAPLTESSSAYNIRFMNSSGIIVKQLTLAQSTWQGSVNNLQPGSYIIQVFNNKTENLVGQTKFVKL